MRGILDRASAIARPVVDRASSPGRRAAPRPPAASRPKTPAGPGPRAGVYQIPAQTIAAIFAAGLNSGEQIVLAEMFEQAYGGLGPDLIRLIPADIARRYGMHPSNVSRSITALADFGILETIAKYSHRFVEDWTRWSWESRRPERLSHMAGWGEPKTRAKKPGRPRAAEPAGRNSR